METRRPWQFRLSSLLGLIALLALVLAAVALFGPEKVWTGHFELKIAIESASKTQIERVSYWTTYTREEAEEIAADYTRYAQGFEPAEYANQCAVVPVRSGGRINALGRERRYVAQRYVVLCINYADGTENVVVVQVPRGRGSRSVTCRLAK